MWSSSHNENKSENRVGLHLNCLDFITRTRTQDVAVGKTERNTFRGIIARWGRHMKRVKGADDMCVSENHEWNEAEGTKKKTNNCGAGAPCVSKTHWFVITFGPCMCHSHLTFRQFYPKYLETTENIKNWNKLLRYKRYSSFSFERKPEREIRVLLARRPLSLFNYNKWEYCSKVSPEKCKTRKWMWNVSCELWCRLLLLFLANITHSHFMALSSCRRA